MITDIVLGTVAGLVVVVAFHSWQIDGLIRKASSDADARREAALHEATAETNKALFRALRQIRDEWPVNGDRGVTVADLDDILAEHNIYLERSDS